MNGGNRGLAKAAVEHAPKDGRARRQDEPVGADRFWVACGGVVFQSRSSRPHELHVAQQVGILQGPEEIVRDGGVQ